MHLRARPQRPQRLLTVSVLGLRCDAIALEEVSEPRALGEGNDKHAVAFLGAHVQALADHGTDPLRTDHPLIILAEAIGKTCCNGFDRGCLLFVPKQFVNDLKKAGFRTYTAVEHEVALVLPGDFFQLTTGFRIGNGGTRSLEMIKAAQRIQPFETMQ